MNVSDFSQYLKKLDSTPKRLEITAILVELIKEMDTSEIENGINLSLGYLQPSYKSEKFNIAEKMVIRALEKTYPSTIKSVTQMYNNAGDLGDVAMSLHDHAKTQTISVNEAHAILLDIARTEGSGSQERKINGIVNLLHKVDALSAKYLIRIILGTTRLGFTELTIVDALSSLSAGNKSLKKEIESKFFIHPDIGLIAKIVKKDGVPGLKDITIEAGVPVLSQKAQRLESIEKTVEKLGECWTEFKFDGTRVQLHLNKSQLEAPIKQEGLFTSTEKSTNYLVRTFTRNLEDSTHQFPDIVAAAKKQLNAKSVILDGEALGIDKKTGEFLPFQQIMQRKRKHAIKEMSEEIPIKYFVFDILYLDGKSLMHLPLEERNAILQKVVEPGQVIQVAEHLQTNTVEDLTKYYEYAKKLNLEGVIVKKPGSPYEAGARSYSWVKLKKADEKLLADSIDAVVLGYYEGRGERSKFGIGGFLIGIYDPKQEKYLTISKVGTGLKDEDWVYLKKEADKLKIKEIPSNVDVPKIYSPDVILSPKIVVEIGADEVSISKTHSAGYALRFPRLLFFRTDKNAMQITTIEEIIDLHKLQKRGNYQK